MFSVIISAKIRSAAMFDISVIVNFVYRKYILNKRIIEQIDTAFI